MLTSLVQRSYQREVWSSMLNLQSYVVLSQRTCFIFVLLVKTDLSVSKIDPSRWLTCAAAETSTAWCICQMFGQNRTATACVHIEADPCRSVREQTDKFSLIMHSPHSLVLKHQFISLGIKAIKLRAKSKTISKCLCSYNQYLGLKTDLQIGVTPELSCSYDNLKSQCNWRSDRSLCPYCDVHLSETRLLIGWRQIGWM